MFLCFLNCICKVNISAVANRLNKLTRLCDQINCITKIIVIDQCILPISRQRLLANLILSVLDLEFLLSSAPPFWEFTSS